MDRNKVIEIFLGLIFIILLILMTLLITGATNKSETEAKITDSYNTYNPPAPQMVYYYEDSLYPQSSKPYIVETKDCKRRGVGDRHYIREDKYKRYHYKYPKSSRESYKVNYDKYDEENFIIADVYTISYGKEWGYGIVYQPEKTKKKIYYSDDDDYYYRAYSRGMPTRTYYYVD